MRSAESLFATWLAAHENGESPDFEALCAANPECAVELRALHSTWKWADAAIQFRGSPSEPDPGLVLEPPSIGENETKVAPLLSRLEQRGPPRGRFVVKERIGKGGMGSVFRVYDSEIGRHVAAKVLHLDDPGFLPRFLEEAQITGQLDHPVFIPVHDFALDEKGRVFFTMKLVKGVKEAESDEVRAETLSEVIEKIHAGSDGWTLTRGISDVITRVAEAMEFAHVKGVVHRDLKPLNILVGRYGEVYVTDFGIARVQGQERAALPASSIPLTRVRTQRRDAIERGLETPPSTQSPISPGPTEEGSTIGTAEYMPPEQAEGRLSEIDARSDIYALGATLYHVIAGVPPWHSHDDHPHRNVIIKRIVSGARPAALHTLAPRAPAELIAIVDKAMAPKIADRYASMNAFAADLRAYDEHRVVSAYETGAVAELKKWVQRNPYLTAAAALLVVVLAGSSVVLSAKNKEVEAKNVEITAQKAAVETQKQLADAKIREFDLLAGKVYLERAIEREMDLYPPWPEKIETMERWLAEDASRLLALKPTLESTLADLRARALPQSDAEREHADLESQASSLEAAVNARRTFTFALESETFLYTTLSDLAASIAAFESGAKAEVERRLAWAKQIGDLTLHHPNARVSWDQARAAILKADDVVASKLYASSPGGPIELEPQMGLVPIGMNPVTKLWEFYDLRSAFDPLTHLDPSKMRIPHFNIDGSARIDVTDDTGIVLVLLPGAHVRLGAQSWAPTAQHFDSSARSDESIEGELPTATLCAFMLSRYEMTQGQAVRVIRTNDSQYHIGQPAWNGPITAAHPLENITWNDAASLLRTLGLDLPTEAQWEYASRAGSNTPWWSGSEIRDLDEVANLCDATAAGIVPDWPADVTLDDGLVIHGPVGLFRGNDFGLHDTMGNVWEWCRDGGMDYKTPARIGDGARYGDVFGSSVIRGGSFIDPPSAARSAFRIRKRHAESSGAIGVRPMRKLCSALADR